MKKISGMFGLIVGLMLVGCAHRPEANISTLDVNNVHAIATRNSSGETTTLVTTKEEEENCQRKWAMTLPAAVPTDPTQAALYSQKVDAIIRECQFRSDMGAAQGMAHNAQAQALGEQIGGAGGVVIGAGTNFLNYPASMPYIVPNGAPVLQSPGADPSKLVGLEKDVTGLIESQVSQEQRIGALEQPKTKK